MLFVFICKAINMMQADRIALAENGRESFVFQPTTEAPASFPPSFFPSLAL